MLTTCFLLVSCNDDDDVQKDDAVQKGVIVLFSPNGLGDLGYNDLIMRGTQLVHKERTDCTIQFRSPQTMDEAETVFTEWLERRLSVESGEKSLLVLASVEYLKMVQRELAARRGDMTNKAILLFETDETLPYSQVYTFKINMYGASYLAGITAAALGMETPIVMLGSATDVPVRTASDGFADGYCELTGKTVPVDAFANDWTGYAMSGKAYEMMAEISASHDFVFPLAGGTNLGIYRYLREHPEGPYVAGMDADQSPFCNNIVGCVIKHIDRLVADGMRQWLDHPEEEAKHMEYGLESGYVEWQLSNMFSQFQLYIDKYKAKAIEREKK